MAPPAIQFPSLVREKWVRNTEQRLWRPPGITAGAPVVFCYRWLVWGQFWEAAGRQLREGLLHHWLRLGEVSKTIVGDIFCVQPWEYFLYSFVTCTVNQSCPSFLRKKKKKWKEKNSSLFLMATFKNNIKLSSVAKPQKLPCRSKSRCASWSYWNSIRNLLDPQ